LINPWGLISSSTSPWWVADNNGGVSTLYNGNTGAVIPLVVNIPPVVTDPKTGKPMGTGTPTGVVFSRGSTTPGSTFQFKSGGKTLTAVFSFVAEDGRISAWPGSGDAITVIDNSEDAKPGHSAVYKGATITQMTQGGPAFLYVANFRSGHIEVYDNTFQPVTLQ